MKTVREIYDTYSLMPVLQHHQIRVAAVARALCDHFSEPLDGTIVILACLFHDMGNIIKSQFDRFPYDNESDKPQEYWEAVKRGYVERYGADEHGATEAIAREIGLPEKGIDIIENMRFSKTRWIFEEAPWEYKIAKYSDLRAAPYGIVPLAERLEEANKRYAGRAFDSDEIISSTSLKASEQVCFDLEKLIFSKTDLTPSDIIEASVIPIIEELWEYQIA
ncbi:MAG TPA: HD domain-containing protein [Candidatus Paceibacterota bacterium]|nr:HD domain-containing protein [Candidatus Paceibacterota bacterium]